MPYAKITPKYRLQSPGIGDVLDSSSERRTAEIIDNQLFGAIRAHSGGHGVMRNGNFSLQSDGGSNYSVLLIESKANGLPVVEAFINQVYVFTESTLSWSGLSASNTYYLGVKLIENTTSSSLQSKDVQTWSNTTGIVPADGILLATVTIDGIGNGTFNTSPSDKVSIPIWGDHIVDNQNPHTPFLMQDSIVCSGLQILGSLTYRTLQVDNLIISGTQVISGNIIVTGNLIISGQVINHGNVTWRLLRVENMEIPGQFLVSELLVSSGADFYCSPQFRKNLRLASGITVDGFDPSEALALLGGGNADHLHGHVLGSLGVGAKPIFLSPEYENTIISGDINSGTFFGKRLFNRNMYEWMSISSGAAFPVSRVFLPQDFERLDRINVTHGVGINGLLSGSNVSLSVYDKDFTECRVLPGNGFLQSTQVTNTDLTVSGGNIVASQPITVVNRMMGYSGIPTLLGDMILWYVPKHGEKVVFDWSISASGNSILVAQNHFDGLRVAPSDLRMEKLIISQRGACSGVTIVGVNVGNAGAEPSTVFTSTNKGILRFNSSGASFQASSLVPSENLGISMNQIISASIDSLASGSSDLSAQLVTYRI